MRSFPMKAHLPVSHLTGPASPAPPASAPYALAPDPDRPADPGEHHHFFPIGLSALQYKALHRPQPSKTGVLFLIWSSVTCCTSSPVLSVGPEATSNWIRQRGQRQRQLWCRATPVVNPNRHSQLPTEDCGTNCFTTSPTASLYLVRTASGYAVCRQTPCR